MNSFTKKIEVRWADLDPNFHVRHSAYYDYGASARIDFLQHNGITLQLMKEKSFGLVIFREECVFKKELTLNDKVSIDFFLLKANADYSRWSLQHTIYKNDDTVAAILTLDGSWIDVIKRKLTVPPEVVVKTFGSLPRASNFEWIIKK
jgi:acyl-CoA thioester hydrolase